MNLAGSRTGHFRLESGHHTELWLDLDQLFARPAVLRPHVAELGRRVSARRIDAVCGPLSGGAFLAQLIAADLGVEFAFAERIGTDRTGLFPVDYRIVPALRGVLLGKRVAIVDDVISTGSTLQAMRDLMGRAGARVVAEAAVFTEGDASQWKDVVALGHLPLMEPAK